MERRIEVDEGGITRWRGERGGLHLRVACECGRQCEAIVSRDKGRRVVLSLTATKGRWVFQPTVLDRQ